MYKRQFRLTAIISSVMLALCVSSGATIFLSRTRCPEEKSVFVSGPGVITLVRVIDVPFAGRFREIKYLTYNGEVIEVRDAEAEHQVLLIPGMTGILTYATQPERVVGFRMLHAEPGSRSSQ